MPKSLLKNTLHCSVLSSFCLTAYANQDQANVVKLDAIVVTASGYEQAIADAPASITVIDREELDKRNYSDITDVLNDVPGVAITGSGSTLDVSIRGMAPKYTLFLVDGKKQDSRTTRPNGDDFGLEKGILPPLQAIERIEVIRGPMSSLYGSDAMGGVVNIITKKVPEQWTGSYDVSTTLQNDRDSGDSVDTNIYLAGPLAKRLAMQVSAGYYNRDEDNIIGGFKGTKRERINSKFTYVLNDKHDLALGLDGSKQIGEETSKTASSNIRGKLRFYRDVFSLTHNGKYTDYLNSTSYIQYDKSKTPDRENTVMTTQNNGIRVNQPIETETLSANTQWNWLLGDHTLSFGAYFKDEDLLDKATNLNVSGNASSEFSRWSSALFFEDTWSLLDNLNVTAGLRWDKDEQYGSHFSPRLYSVYHLNDNITFKGGVTTGYKQPDLREAADGFWQVSGRGRNIILGNPDLKPEKSTTYEIGTVWQGDLFNASVTAYHTKFEDKLQTYADCTAGNRNDSSTWTCTAPDGQTKYYSIVKRTNVDEAEINGVEVTFDTELNDWSTVRANYTFTDSEQKSGANKGRPLNDIPKHNANVTLDTQPTDAVNVWARFNYRGETTSSTNIESYPAYNFYDVGLNYKFNQNITAKFAVNNVFDTVLTSDEDNKVLDGRRYTIGLTTNF
ncbi:TonB-dependent receptor domain-containing protein [Acinetobacter puyangensis]|uniref:TonB-dependent receptor domain-containing protein n=1 Tax=Acinetobacter puyangensis TaxID=1096779 RepID=UPI003A4DDCB2